jgi:hypothetical protein
MTSRITSNFSSFCYEPINVSIPVGYGIVPLGDVSEAA